MARYNLKNLYLSQIKQRTLLNDSKSIKKTYHIVLDIKGSNMEFAPGDCLGIVPENDPALVNKCIKYINGLGSDIIIHQRTYKEYSLKTYLTKKANISKIKPALLKLILKKSASDKVKNEIEQILNDKTLLKDYIESHELWDTLADFSPVNISSQEICNVLFPMLPRLYSISSAYCTAPDEVHLTVSYLIYETSSHTRYGVTSHYLCDFANENIRIYIHHSHKFFLPKKTTAPIIMVGTGAGIAPFMSFIQHRYFNKNTGKNWLFFGECNKANDFYYHEFLEKLEAEEFIKITTAFSRDQKEKVYVQHRLLENKKDVWQWLQEDATFYVCGDAKRMARDIEKILLTIIKEEGNLSAIEANNYLQKLIEDKRYLKDVY